jgi:hypothetical protein
MWTRTGQPGLWFTAGAFSQARIYSRYIALQIDAIEQGRLAKRIQTRNSRMIRKSVQRFSLRQTRSVCAEIMRQQQAEARHGVR